MAGRPSERDSKDVSARIANQKTRLGASSGRVAEWLIAGDLKSPMGCTPHVGSNPTPSAITRQGRAEPRAVLNHVRGSSSKLARVSLVGAGRNLQPSGKTGHRLVQNRPLGMETGQHPDRERKPGTRVAKMLLRERDDRIAQREDRRTATYFRSRRAKKNPARWRGDRQAGSVV